MIEFIRELLNLRREKRCESCEILKQQLALVQNERNKLLDKLLESPEKVEVEQPQIEYKDLKPKFIPWPVRQQILEKESAQRAKLMRDKTEEIEKAKKATATTEDREKIIVGE